MKKTSKTPVSKTEIILPPKGLYLIEIQTPEGVRWTGPGKDWLVKDLEKGQVYKTRNGAERWIEKFAKNQGKTKIISKE